MDWDPPSNRVNKSNQSTRQLKVVTEGCVLRISPLVRTITRKSLELNFEIFTTFIVEVMTSWVNFTTVCPV